MKVTLLPRKEIEFKLSDKTLIKGKYGTWAAKRFCDKKNLSIVDFIERFADTTKLSFDDISTLLLCAVEYVHRKEAKGPFPYSDVDACEWLEELGGIGSEEFVSLLNHFASELDPEKKSQEVTVS